MSKEDSYQKQTICASHSIHTEIEMACLQRTNQAETSVIELKLGIWFFQACHSFQLSLSSLYLAVSTLDRLRRLGFKIQQTQKNLLVGTIILLISKFNEVRQLQIKKINNMQGSQFTLGEYQQMQGRILETLSFQVVDQQNVYYKLISLHYKYKCPERIQLFCKLHLKNEEIRRFGNSAFINAVTSVFNPEKIGRGDKQNKRSIQQVAKILLSHQTKTTS